MTERILIFGAGELGIRACRALKKMDGKCRVLSFADNNPNLQGKYLKGLKIISPEKIPEMDFDRIVIANQYIMEVSSQLRDLGIRSDKIDIPDLDDDDDGFIDFRRKEFISALFHLACFVAIGFSAVSGFLLLT